MTFLNPLMLYGLFALAIPVIIHLFNFRRPKKILFSNVKFLLEIRSAVIKRMRLKQWLILLARMLGIAFLVFAFANPVYKKHSGTTTPAGNSSVIILLDNSLSMQAQDEFGSYLKQAKETATAILDAYSASDEFILQDARESFSSGLFKSRDKIFPDLENMNYAPSALPLTARMTNASQLFSSARNANKILYVIGDMQKSTFGELNALKNFDKDVHVEFIPIGKNAPRNIAVGNVELKTKIIERGKPIHITSEVFNYGQQDEKEISLTLIVNGKESAISSISLLKEQSAPAEFTFTPDKPGWYDAYISLEDFPMEFDNTRFFSFYVPEGKKIAVLKGADADERFLKLALESAGSKKIFELQIVSEKDAGTLNFDDYEGVILLGMENMSSGIAERIKNFIANGRGILFFPSEKMNLQDMNVFLSLMNAGNFLRVQKSGKEKIAFDKIDFQHPLFEGVFEKKKSGQKIESPEIKMFAEFKPLPKTIFTPVISLNNGIPFLSEIPYEDGKIYVFAVSPDLRWSDFPLKDSFVPLIFRSALSSCSNVRYKNSYSLGEKNIIFVKTKSPTELVHLVRGTSDIIPEQTAGIGKILLTVHDNLNEAGNYDVVQSKADGEILEKLSFNYPADESHPASYSAEELQNILNENGLKNFSVTRTSENNSAASVLSEKFEMHRTGISLWKYCVILSLLMFLSEILLIRFLKTEPVPAE